MESEIHAAFFEDLRRWGFQVLGERSFADHHVYTAREMAELEQHGRQIAEPMLCSARRKMCGISGMSRSLGAGVLLPHIA